MYQTLRLILYTVPVHKNCHTALQLYRNLTHFAIRYGINYSSFRSCLLVEFFISVSLQDVQGEERKPILLIPELCLMTGISEEMRSNFSIMKDIGQHTRVNPGNRTRELEKFLHQINA